MHDEVLKFNKKSRRDEWTKTSAPAKIIDRETIFDISPIDVIEINSHRGYMTLVLDPIVRGRLPDKIDVEYNAYDKHSIEDDQPVRKRSEIRKIRSSNILEYEPVDRSDWKKTIERLARLRNSYEYGSKDYEMCNMRINELARSIPSV